MSRGTERSRELKRKRVKKKQKLKVKIKDAKKLAAHPKKTKAK
jgi:hypothetical protein